MNLKEMGAEAAAKTIGKVEKSNYLAHTIREMELTMLGILGWNYHILTYASKWQNKTAEISFFDRGCIIRLPAESEDMDDRKIRLILAHELGHLGYNFDKLKNAELLTNAKRTVEEEVFAWEFAYHLILFKSDELKNDINRNRFIYRTDDLKTALASIIRDDKSIYGPLAQSLNLPK
jgi:hypothetical protein